MVVECGAILAVGPGKATQVGEVVVEGAAAGGLGQGRHKHKPVAGVGIKTVACAGGHGAGSEDALGKHQGFGEAVAECGGGCSRVDAVDAVDLEGRAAGGSAARAAGVVGRAKALRDPRLRVARAEKQRHLQLDDRLVLRSDRVGGEARVERHREVEAAEQGLLFVVGGEVRKHRPAKELMRKIGPLIPLPALRTDRIAAPGRLMIGCRQHDLPQVVGAAHPPACLPRRLHRRQQKPDQRADDRHDDEQLNKGEAAEACHARTPSTRRRCRSQRPPATMPMAASPSVPGSGTAAAVAMPPTCPRPEAKVLSSVPSVPNW